MAISAAAPSKYRELHQLIRVFFRRKLAVIGLIIIVVFILTALLAPILAPYEHDKLNVKEQLLHPSWEHLLGTDDVGRDTLSRVIYGSRTSLMIGILATAMSASFGMALGLIAAYYGGIVFNIIMRLMDTLMSIPMILLALIIAALLGGGVINVIIALGFGMIAAYARLMCGQALTIMQNDYVLAERSMGANGLRIMLRHILPNAFPPLLVMATIQLGAVILMEASLSFLGIGITAPTPAWGSMINIGYRNLLTNPELSFAPGVALMLVVFGFNMLGDGLRDTLDPRLRGLI